MEQIGHMERRDFAITLWRAETSAAVWLTTCCAPSLGQGMWSKREQVGEHEQAGMDLGLREPQEGVHSPAPKAAQQPPSCCLAIPNTHPRSPAHSILIASHCISEIIYSDIVAKF